MFAGKGVLCLTLGNLAVAADKGFCPPHPPLSSPRRTEPLQISTTNVVTASVVAVISDKGYVCSARMVEKVDKDVQDEVVSTIRKWHFDPAKKDGRAVPVVIAIQVNLRRDEAGKLVVGSTSPPTATQP